MEFLFLIRFLIDKVIGIILVQCLKITNKPEIYMKVLSPTGFGQVGDASTI